MPLELFMGSPQVFAKHFSLNYQQQHCWCGAVGFL